MTEVEIERLVVRIAAEAAPYKKGMDQVIRTTQETGKVVEKEAKSVEVFGKTIDELGTKMSTFAGSFIALKLLQSPFEGLKDSVDAAADMETLSLKFETLTGSAAGAKAVLDDLRQFAEATPFEMPEIANAATMMMAMGTETKKIVPTMQMLGDISAGLNIPIGQLSYLFGTLQSQGRAFTVDINQFAMRGIPIWDELGKMFKKTKMEMREMVEKGKIGFKEVEQAFKNMSGEGGKFGGGMEKQSKSFNGLLSTMGDNLNNVMITVGQNVIETFKLKEAIQLVTEALDSVNKGLISMGSNMKAVITWTVTLTASTIALLYVWKIGSLVVGMVVGTMAHIWVTVKSVTAATWAWVVALKAQTVVTYQATAASAMGLAMMEKVVVVNRAAVVAALALKAAMGGAIIAAALHWSGAFDASSHFNGQIEKSIDLTGQLVAAMEKRDQKKFKELEAITDPAARQVAYREELAQAEKHNMDLEDSRARARKAVENYSKNNNDDLAWSWLSPVTTPAEAEFKELEIRLADIERLYAQHVPKLIKLREDGAKALAPAADNPEIKKEIEELTAKLQLQAATFGMTADEIEMYKIKMMAVTDEDKKFVEGALANARGLAAMNAELKERKKAEEEVAKAEKKRVEDKQALMDDIMRMGADVDPIADKLTKLLDLGATTEELAMAESIMATNKALEERKEVMKTAEAVTKEFRGADEVYVDTMNELNMLLDEGLISWETYDRASSKAAEELMNVGDQAEEAMNQIQKLDAALSGSAEAEARIAAFQDLVKFNDGPAVERARELAEPMGKEIPWDGRDPVLAARAFGGAGGDPKDISVLLSGILAAVTITAKKPGAEVVDADFEG